MTRAARETVDFTAAYLMSDAEKVVEYALMFGQIAGFTAPSPAKEGIEGEVNQDAVAFFAHGEKRVVLAVADGLGGHPGGDEASNMALLALESELAKTDDDAAGVRAAILAAFERANHEIMELDMGGGTTLVVAEIHDGKLRTYHVGDSCALLCGGRGRVKLQTVAHSPVGYALEAGMIDEAEALVHEERHLVSNVVGDANMHVEIGRPIRLKPRDTLLLASDGLFDNLRTNEIIDMVRGGQLGESTVALVEECRRRMTTPTEELSKPDDLAVVVYRPG